MFDRLIVEVGFVPLVPHVADQVGPRDAIGGLDEPGVGDGAEGLANVRGVGDVAVGGEKDGAQASGVGGVAEIGVCGFVGSVGVVSQGFGLG